MWFLFLCLLSCFQFHFDWLVCRIILFTLGFQLYARLQKQQTKYTKKSQSHTHTVNNISPQGLGISSHFLSFSFYSAELHFFYICIRCLYNCMAIIMIENIATKTMFTFQILCFVDIKTNWMHIFQSVTLFSCCGVFSWCKKICMLYAQCAIWWLLRFFYHSTIMRTKYVFSPQKP